MFMRIPVKTAAAILPLLLAVGCATEEKPAEVSRTDIEARLAASETQAQQAAQQAAAAADRAAQAAQRAEEAAQRAARASQRSDTAFRQSLQK